MTRRVTSGLRVTVVLVLVFAQFLSTSLIIPQTLLAAQAKDVSISQIDSPVSQNLTSLHEESAQPQVEETPVPIDNVPPPSGAPSIPSVPALLDLETSHYVIGTNQPVTLTLTVHPATVADLEGRQLTLQLPNTLHLLSVGNGITTTTGVQWLLPSILEQPFRDQVVVESSSTTPGLSLEILAEIAEEGFQSVQTALLLTNYASQDSATVVLNPESIQQGITISISEEISSTEVVTPASAQLNEIMVGSQPSALSDFQPGAIDQSTKSKTYLPLISSITTENATNSAGNSQVTSNKPKKKTKIWHIEAQKHGNKVEKLGKSALLIIPAKELIASNIDPKTYRVWTRESKQDDWQPAQTEYRANEQIYVVHTKHFSYWWLNDKLTTSGHLLPSMHGFSTDLSTGFATINIPLNTPDGLGGMTPNLSLAYSSGSVDGMRNDAGSTAHTVQSNWAGGLGWSLGGLSYIAHDFGNNTDVMVLNGMTFKITGSTTEPQSLYSVFHAGDDSDHYINDGNWTVKAADGLTYYFGAFNFGLEEEPGPATALILDEDKLSTSIWHTAKKPIKWYLQRVVDPNGNYINYTYSREPSPNIPDVGPGVPATCGYQIDGKFNGTGPAMYDKATYLEKIEWSGSTGDPNTTVDDVAPKLQVRFIREGRPGSERSTQDKIDNKACSQALYSDMRLSEIVVQAADATNANNWITIQGYTLTYTYDNLHSKLILLWDFRTPVNINFSFLVSPLKSKKETVIRIEFVE